MSLTPLEKAKQWVKEAYFDQSDRNGLQKLIDEDQKNVIDESFYQELEFGTGGLRNIIGFGSNRINKYTIRKACQAICNIIKQSIADKDQLVCIGYDSRQLSDLFAQEAAKVFAGNNIKVKLFDQLYPVPLLSYSIKYFKACAGVMITASHNPPQYNGLKAYWSDASQLTPPIDRKVIDAYSKITNWNEILITKSLESELISYCGDDILNEYTQMSKSYLCNPELLETKGSELSVVYTPLHGTGAKAIEHVAKYFGLTKVHTVKEQREPDSRFPTVDVPNPEYPVALKMATDLMHEINADIALGSDPDTDRLGVAYLDDGETKFLDGNQIGVLLLDYKLDQLSKQEKLPSDALVIKTIVTSELQQKIADHYGVKVLNSLTGFKWMGKIMRQLKQDNKDFSLVFANEESYGYLAHDKIADKDGINAFLLMSECALYHKTQGRNLTQALNQIYKKYGRFQESLLCLHYPGRSGKKIMNAIMEKFRSPQTTSFISDKIVKKIDLLESSDFPKSNVLCLTFNNGHSLWMRPSGTEPKIKFYSMYTPKENMSLDQNAQQASLWITQVEKQLARLSEEFK